MICKLKSPLLPLRMIVVVILSFTSLGVLAQNSLFWKVTGKKKNRVSYIYGTFHTADERAFFLMDTLEHYLGECDVFAGEVNLEELNQNPAEMMKYVLMEDSTLQDLFEPDDFNTVRDSLIGKLGMGAMMMMKIKPFFIVPMLTLMEGEGLSELSGDVIIDDYLQNKALEYNLEVRALETFEEAVGAIDAISLKEQAEILLDAILSGSSDSDMEELVEKYVQQDLTAMLLYMQEEEMNSNMEKSIVENRNLYFSERLIRMMKKKNVFCAVGALHLPGETGLIRTLRNEGYDVEAIILQ